MNIVESFKGHFWSITDPKVIWKNFDKARKENKIINLSTGRFVIESGKWWSHHKYPIAIPRDLALSQKEANHVFNVYIKTHFGSEDNENTNEEEDYQDEDSEEDDDENTDDADFIVDNNVVEYEDNYKDDEEEEEEEYETDEDE